MAKKTTAASVSPPAASKPAAAPKAARPAKAAKTKASDTPAPTPAKARKAAAAVADNADRHTTAAVQAVPRLEEVAEAVLESRVTGQLTGPADLEAPYIEVYGAREHNLKNVSIQIPRGRLVVFTGISGSGKSSLAFDTIYAEGQRRYMETFSAYARSFMGGLERPDVDKIEGLSPVISIEQKTTSRNPRSTVGTITEIYDFLRLLYARTAEAFSYATGQKMIRQSDDQIINYILKEYDSRKLVVLAPVVKGRKGHYRELFQQIAKLGFTKVRVDGELLDITPKMQVDRYKIHDIEIVIDRLVVKEEDRFRLSGSVQNALTQGKGTMLVLDPDKKKDNTQFFSRFLMDPATGIAYDDPAPNTFSFNSPYGACPTCNGLGEVQEITEESVMPDKKLSISRGGIAPLGEYRDIWIFQQLSLIVKKHKASLSTPIEKLPQDLVERLLHGVPEDEDADPKKANYVEPFEGIIPFLRRQMESDSENIREWIQQYTQAQECPECHGYRLKKESLHFKIDGKHIGELSVLDLNELAGWFEGLEDRLSERQNLIARELLKEIRKRIGFLLEVGLDYLNLHRSVRTLSGGESQRIRLATQIGTQLVGVLYIMDEPSIGLHQRDNERLIKALQHLRDLGNSVIVVEHDKDMILHADYVLDIGPGAGIHGGQIVAEGTPTEIFNSGSLTSQYLSGQKHIELRRKKRAGEGNELVLKGAKGHNLKNVTAKFPLGKLIAVTGVSGSGKSSLIHDTLYPILNQHFFNAKREPLPYAGIEGLDFIDKVIEVDQSPIGRTPRSNPATYTGVFTEIRQLFASLPEAKIRGYGPGRFSFNVKGGRCETCEGAGMRTIEMNFLPDVHVPCETCKGRRYNRETLEVRFKGKSITDVLDMTVEKAVEFFEFQPRILRKIQTLNEVGLGYLTLGQQATTLSGGEAQRVKLATELSKKDTGKTFYILDEPTTGLHFEDINHLALVLHKLADKGNTVLIIEHNLDLIKVADHIIDIGPEGGAGGGTIVAQGTPEQVAKSGKGHTSRFLAEELRTSKYAEEKPDKAA
ncbi:excinuclease ABC subunit A [Hymenobacter luteus]|uniref:UvrABC system protein A n=2 Tax=Hymenobacter TaxID=89966 RepID=A0A7W9WDZ1_9BACT|nr:MULTISPECIES: excinuclease ABC subunit UvrA [Hymenobacter]MBB4603244.1 excinuclease ABC subunit A [Hymenobacter latericoloratus]MBB6060142.1 excinuclease ABC subunit A [Hymenobacter luteus]